MMGALNELGSRGLIGWSHGVVSGHARRGCLGHLRYPLRWLARQTWSVMLVVCWLSSGATPGLDGHGHRACGTGHQGDQPGVAFTRHLPSMVMIIVCAGA